MTPEQEAEMCPHAVVQTWRLQDTGELVGLWSCVVCNQKFVPISQLIRAEAELTTLRATIEAQRRLVEKWREERPKWTFGIGMLVWDMSSKRADELAATLPPKDTPNA